MDFIKDTEWQVFDEELKTFGMTRQNFSSIHFLVKYWQQKWQIHEETNQILLKEYANSLYDSLKLLRIDIIKEEQEVLMAEFCNIIPTGLRRMSVALLVKLLAVAYAEQARAFVISTGKILDIPKEHRVLELFSKIVDTEFGDPDVSLKKIYTLSHQKLALRILFHGTSSFDQYFSNSILTSSETNLEELGIVRAVDDGYEFKYPLFADFFAAQFLLEQLNDKLIIKFLLQVVFVEVKYYRTCAFIDQSFFENPPSSNILRQIDSIFYDNWLPNEKKIRDLFTGLNLVIHSLIAEQHCTIFKVIFDLLKRRRQIMVQLLQNTTLVANNNVVWLAIKYLPPDLVKGLLCEVIALLPENVVGGFFVNAVEKHALRIAVMKNDCATLEFLIKYVKRACDPDHLRKLLLRPRSNVLLVAAKQSFYSELLQFIFELLSQYLDDELLTEMVVAKTIQGSNILYLALQHCTPDTIEFLVKHLRDKDLLRDMLMEENESGTNVVHSAFRNKDAVVLTYLINNLLKTELDENVIQDILTGRNDRGANVIHLSVKHSDYERINHVLQTIKCEVTDVNTYKQMLVQTNANSENLLNIAAQRDDINIFRIIRDLIAKEVDEGIAEEMLHNQCVHGTNVIYTAMSQQNIANATAFLQYFRTLFTPTVIKDFLMAENEHFQNLFLVTAWFGKFVYFEFLHEQLKIELGREDLLEMLLSRSASGSNILHLAARNRNTNFFQLLIDFLKHELDSETVRTLLLSKSVYGQTILDRIAADYHQSKFESAVVILKNEIPENFKEVLASSTYEDMSLLALTFSEIKNSDLRKCKKFFEYLLLYLKQELGGDAVSNMMSAKDKDGSNMLHTAAAGHICLVEYVIQHLQSLFDVSTVRTMILKSNDNGSTVVHAAIQHLKISQQSPSNISKLFETLKSFVDIKPLLRTKDIKGNNIIHLAFITHDFQIVENVVRLLDSELGEQVVNSMIKQRNNSDANVFDIAAKPEHPSQQPSVVIETINFIARRLGVDGLKQMSLENDKQGGNPFHNIFYVNHDQFQIERILQCLRKHLGADSYKEVLRSLRTSAKNILHVAVKHTNARTMKVIIEHVGRELGAASQKELLLAKTKRKVSVFDRVLEGDDQTFFYLMSSCKGLIEENVYKTHLIDKFKLAIKDNNHHLMQRLFIYLNEELPAGWFEETVLQKSKIINLAAAKCDLAFITSFMKLIQAELTESNLKKAIGWSNIIQNAANNKHKSVVKYFVDLCKAKSNKKNFVTQLKTKIELDGSNLLHIVVKNGNYSTVGYIFETLENELPDSDFKEMLISQTKNGENLILLSVNSEEKLKYKQVMAVLKRHLDVNVVQEMLIAKNKDPGYNVWLRSVHNPSSLFFLWEKLKEELPSSILKSMLMKHISDGSNALHAYIRTGVQYMICYLVDFLKSTLDENEIRDMLQEKTELNNNILHVAMLTCNSSTTKFVFQLLKTYLDTTTLRSLILAQTEHGSNVFHHAVKINCVFSIPVIYDQIVLEFEESLIATDMLLATNKFQQNIFYIAVREGLTQNVQKVIQFVKTKCSTTTLKKMLQAIDKNGENLFHGAVRNQDSTMLQVTTNCLLQEFDETTVQEMLLATPSNKQNLLHFAARASVDLIPIFEFLQRTFDENKARQMLLAENARNQNLMHIAARYNLPLDRILYAVKRLFDPTTVIPFLKSVERFGNNVFGTVFMYEHHMKLEKFISCYKTELDAKTVELLLTAQNYRKENIIHTAVHNAEGVHAIRYLLSQLALELDKRVILNMILGPNSYGLTIFDREFHDTNRDEAIIKDIVSYLDQNVLKLSTHVKLEMHKHMVLHVIILTADADVLEYYLKFMKETVEPAVTNEALRAITKDGDSIIHSAIHSKDIVLMEKLLDHLFHKLNLNTAHEMFVEQNNNGSNAVSLAVEIGSVDIIRFFLSVLLVNFLVEVRSPILLAKNRNGENCFHLLVQKFDESLLTTALELLDLEQRANALLSSTNYNCNVLHIAIAKSDIPSVELIESEKMVSETLNLTTKNGENVLHLAARNPNGEMLKHVIESIQSKLSSETCEAMYLATTNYGSNVFHILAKKNEKESFVFYTDFLTENLDLDVVKTMLSTKNHLGNDVLSILDNFEETQLADALKQFVMQPSE